MKAETATSGAVGWPPTNYRDLFHSLIDDLASFCDASNWDHHLKRGDEFRAWRDATDALMEKVLDYQYAEQALRREATAPELAVSDAAPSSTTGEHQGA